MKICLRPIKSAAFRARWVKPSNLDGEEDWSFLAEDLQHRSLSGSVSDNGGQYQKDADDNGKRLPESSQKKAQYDKNNAEDNSENPLTPSHILSDSHLCLLINPSYGMVFCVRVLSPAHISSEVLQANNFLRALSSRNVSIKPERSCK